MIVMMLQLLTTHNLLNRGPHDSKSFHQHIPSPPNCMKGSGITGAKAYNENCSGEPFLSRNTEGSVSI